MKYEKQGRVAYVTMNRPRQFNTIGRAMSFQLDEALMEACEDDEVRCIVLAGAGSFEANYGPPGLEAYMAPPS